jgi:hypothetical protein
MATGSREENASKQKPVGVSSLEMVGLLQQLRCDQCDGYSQPLR